ncbi:MULTISPECIES: hypothetical protein [Actinomadura]|uniref:hypothetical protein n=1 Tax=Actinomadura TaxID=1988 RepID=UPI00041E22A3|nr:MULTISPECIES: hypothetical protein [Actinomadura]
MEQQTVRRAARWGLTPGTTAPISLGLAVLAAVWFSDAARTGAVAGALLLAATVVLARVDAALARAGAATRRQVWRSALLRRAEEAIVYAGLAAGAAAGPAAGGAGPLASAGTVAPGGPAGVWGAAALALVLPALGRTIAASFAARHPAAVPGRPTGLARLVVLPRPERFALVSVTAALGDPVLVFTVLTAWGAVAVAAVLAGCLLRSLWPVTP